MFLLLLTSRNSAALAATPDLSWTKRTIGTGGMKMASRKPQRRLLGDPGKSGCGLHVNIGNGGSRRNIHFAELRVTRKMARAPLDINAKTPLGRDFC